MINLKYKSRKRTIPSTSYKSNSTFSTPAPCSDCLVGNVFILREHQGHVQAGVLTQTVLAPRTSCNGYRLLKVWRGAGTAVPSRWW